MSLNKVQLIGNLGQDPDARHSQAGALVVNLSVATSEIWRDKATGEKKERTEWHRVVVFNEAKAKFARDYLKKGNKIYIDGQLRTRKWQGDDGQDRWTTEIVVPAFGGDLQNLDRPPSNRPPPADNAGEYGRETTRDGDSGRMTDDGRTGRFDGDMNDDIPF